MARVQVSEETWAAHRYGKVLEEDLREAAE
jgi:hypothetical protein